MPTRINGRLADAVACYQRVLELQPQASAAHYNIANVLAQQGQLEQAVTHYREALALDPGLAEAHNNLGNACKELGRADEARAHYQRAIALAPNYVAAHDNMARMLLSDGNLAEAFGLLQRALALGPTSDTKVLIVRCLQNLQPTSDDPDLRALILRALSEAWVGANELAPTIALFLKQAACDPRCDRAREQRLAAPVAIGRTARSGGRRAAWPRSIAARAAAIGARMRHRARTPAHRFALCIAASARRRIRPRDGAGRCAQFLLRLGAAVLHQRIRVRSDR